MGELRNALKTLSKQFSAEDIKLGRLGVVDENGNAVFDAPGRPVGYVQVRVLGGQEGSTVIAALNLGVPLIYDAQVRLEPDPLHPSEYQIKQVDDKYLSANPLNGPPSVPPHRHYIGSGDDDPVELRRIIPGRVWSSGGLTINVDPFPYQSNGNDQYFPGAIGFDISSHVPGGGTQRWVVVTVDPGTNAVSIVDGPTSSFISPTYANLLSISTGAKIANAGVILKTGQTIIPEASIYELRPILSVVVKDNLGAFDAPTSSDDNTLGYSVGSQWIDITHDDEYVCVQASTGTAIWKKRADAGIVDIPSSNAVLPSDVSMPSSGTDYDSVEIGLTPGIWFVCGSVTVSNALLTTFTAKLWDGSTIFDSGQSYSTVTKISFNSIISVNTTTYYRITVSANVINSTILSANNATQLNALRIADNTLSSGTPIGLLLALTRT